MFGSQESGSSILPNVFQEESAFNQICPNLTFNQRVIGYFACIGVGWVLSLVGSLVLIAGPTADNITLFIILYIIGTVMLL